MPRPLEGKQILNTRARHQAAALSTLLEQRGAQVLEVPMLEIIPPHSWLEFHALIDELTSDDWIVFTSSNGARVVAEHAAGVSREKFSEQLQLIPVAAIGEKTAEAAREHGFAVSFVSEEANSEAFGEEFSLVLDQRCQNAIRKPRIALFRGDIASTSLPEILGEAGYEAVNVCVYHSIPPVVSPAKKQALLSPMDAILFTSSQAVRNFIAQFGPEDEEALEVLKGTAVIVIGAKTGHTASDLDFRQVYVAESSSVESLAELVEELLSE